mmetsp:Transcript_27168/g.86275  ORF Transcript_27168/g.86275 Transcript_27168/m.86275 type:complete len:199 (-) Transcript_27168:381-977(-)
MLCACSSRVLPLCLVSRYKRASHAVLQMAAATRTLDGPGICDQASLLTGVVDRLGDECINEMSHAVARNSAQTVATMSQLQARFAQVKVAGERAVLVPDKGGMWGHALAALITSAMGMAKFRDLAVDNRFDASGVISLAADWMEQGNLLEAVRELRRLGGQPASVCVGWLESAEQRLLAEQVRAAIHAEVDVALGCLC